MERSSRSGSLGKIAGQPPLDSNLRNNRILTENKQSQPEEDKALHPENIHSTKDRLNDPENLQKISKFQLSLKVLSSPQSNYAVLQYSLLILTSLSITESSKRNISR